MFLECLYIPETAVLIQENILIPLCWLLLPNNTDLWDVFHVNLHTLSGILHLFVGLRRVFWVWKFGGHSTPFSQKTVEA